MRVREPAGDGVRSEQSGCSVDAVAHPIRMNERARVQAALGCDQPLDLLSTGFRVAAVEAEPSIEQGAGPLPGR
jgi:hypothetical protein